MGLRIHTGISTLGLQRQLKQHTTDLGGAFERLASGLRINGAADDAAGLGMANRLRTRGVSLDAGASNAENLKSLLETTSSALAEVLSLMDVVKEKSLAATDGTLSDEDRETLDTEYRGAIEEIQRLVADTEYNGKKLLQGGTVTSYVGQDTADAIVASLPAVIGSYFNTFSNFDLDSVSTARNIQGFIDNARGVMDTYAGLTGSYVSRLDSTVRALESNRDAQFEAESRIRDVDFAEETAAAVRARILTEGTTALLSQANSQADHVVQLLNHSFGLF